METEIQLNTQSQDQRDTLRRYVFSEEYMRLLLLVELSSFREQDGFLAQLSKFKLLSWHDDMREQLLDEFVWRIITLLQHCLNDPEQTRRHLLSMVKAFGVAHAKLVEAGLMLVEKCNCSRKALKVKHQSANHYVPDHFGHRQVRPLKHWFYCNWESPFPSIHEKTQLATATGLQVSQVQAWFINWRDRNWKAVREGLQQRRREEAVRLLQLRHGIAHYHAAMHTYAAGGATALDALADSRAALASALELAGVAVQHSPADGADATGPNGSFVEVLDERGYLDDSVSLTELVAMVCAQVREEFPPQVSLPPELMIEGDGDYEEEDD